MDTVLSMQLFLVSGELRHYLMGSSIRTIGLLLLILSRALSVLEEEVT